MNEIISWNLPPWVVYTPILGIVVLPLMIILTNPDKEQRQYSLIMRTWQNEQVINEDSVTIDDSQYIQLGGYESAIVYSDIAPPFTDVIIELAVIDDIGKHVASVTSQLLSAAPPTMEVAGVIPALVALTAVNAVIAGGI